MIKQRLSAPSDFQSAEAGIARATDARAGRACAARARRNTGRGAREHRWRCAVAAGISLLVLPAVSQLCAAGCKSCTAVAHLSGTWPLQLASLFADLASAFRPRAKTNLANFL